MTQEDYILFPKNPQPFLPPGGTVATMYDPKLGRMKTIDAQGTEVTMGNVTIDDDSAYVTLTGAQEITNKTLTGATIKGYTESTVAATITGGGVACTLSLANGTVQTATLTASTACTFTMPTVTAGKSFTLLLKQAASTGNGTATFTGVKWSAAGAPTITATAGKMDILTFIADGINWYGSYTQGFTP